MGAENEIAKFHASVDDRFGFLAAHGFDVVKRTTIADRYGSILFKGPYGEIAISWDAYDGGLEATLNGANVWEILVASGDWERPGYQGSTVEAIQRGLDRIARYLSAHPSAGGLS